MKYCEEYAALLDLYVDGELSPEEMAAVQEHLDQCPDCRRYVDEILEIRAAFPDVEETPVPEGFADGADGGHSGRHLPAPRKLCTGKPDAAGSRFWRLWRHVSRWRYW